MMQNSTSVAYTAVKKFVNIQYNMKMFMCFHHGQCIKFCRIFPSKYCQTAKLTDLDYSIHPPSLRGTSQIYSSY